LPISGRYPSSARALEGFVRAASLELPRKLRINAVSPPWVKETMIKLGMDPTPGLASAEVAKAYVAAVEGSHQGVILDPRQLGK
jgi:NAD(P)-dependent dehydrogenase (short-subunit alcohol dehydrogenase family)